MNSHTGHTRRRIFTLDGSNDADSRKDMPLSGFRWYCSSFYGWNTPKNNFWGHKWAFLSQTGKILKVSCYRNYCIDFNLTKFSTTIEITKWSSWVVPIGAQQIQYGGRRHFEKTVKSPYLCDRSIDFDEIWQDDKHWPRTADLPLKFRIFENPRLNDLYKIWCAYAKWAFYPTIKKLYFINPRWRTAAILKTVKSPYICNLLTDFD